MTAASVEAAIMDLIHGYAKVTEGVKNLEGLRSESLSDHARLAKKLDEVVVRLDHRLGEITTTLALLKKDVDDLKARADESRKNRWALSIAILSALLSLGSAILVTFVKKS